MKNKRRIIFIMTCIIFMMNHSSILEAESFNKELGLFVKENRLSHEELNEIIGRINKIENINKRELKQELEKIGKFRSLREKNNNLYLVIRNKGFELIEVEDSIMHNVISKKKNRIIYDRQLENNLRIRE